MYNWRGIPHPTTLEDAWLDRLFNIPGIAIYQIEDAGFSFTLYPWPSMSELNSITSELEETYVDHESGDKMASVSSGSRIAFPWFSVWSYERYPGWWEEVIKRLEDFASKRDLIPPTIQDFEKDILLGASESFSFKQKSMPYERYAGPYVAGSTPSSNEAATRFFEELAELNQASVYDLYLAELDALGGIDAPLRRWYFGHEAALRGHGLWHYNMPPPHAIYKVPVWWSVAPGRFEVCVHKLPKVQDGFIGEVLMRHNETAISSKLELKEDENGKFFGCKRMSISDDSYDKLQKLAAKQGGTLRCETMEGDEVAEFVAGSFPRHQRDRVLDEITHVLATCYARG
jgi:hypothetical protein